jgi:putative FmdB family regulatory protein
MRIFLLRVYKLMPVKMDLRYNAPLLKACENAAPISIENSHTHRNTIARQGPSCMPIYEYRCSACGAELEKLRKISDPPLLECPACGKETLIKLVSASSFRLKGSGWYETDFKTGKKKNGAGEDSSASADAAASAGGSSDASAPESAKASSDTASKTSDSSAGAKGGEVGKEANKEVKKEQTKEHRNEAPKGSDSAGVSKPTPKA